MQQFNIFFFASFVACTCIFEPRHEKNRSSAFLTRFDTDRAEQPQKMARGFKFRVLKVERLYYLCSESKGADQLCSYCADNICVLV